ncbi:MAG: RNA methyltransferase [Defluviitaleaceae bacterium]|nr:RNA methyltransferase [Defluviitaleaceae bacterium]
MIQSGSKNLFKKLVRLNDKKARNESGLFVVEGEKFVKDIGYGFDITEYIFSEGYLAKNDFAAFDHLNSNICHVFSDDDFARISDTVTPQGILAVVKQKTYSFNDIISNDDPFIIIGENINDPGNMGTVIRTADACGCDGVVFTEQSADIYNPKVIRSTAGSLCHLPVIQGQSLLDVVSILKQHQVKIIAASLKGEFLPYDVNLSRGVAILLGNESGGLTIEAEEMADVLVKIPMVGKAESLNASVAGGVLMYEVVRQRLMS